MLQSDVFNKSSIPKIYDNNYLIDLEELELSELELELCKELVRRTKQDEKEHGTAIQHGVVVMNDGREFYYTSGRRDSIDLPTEILTIANLSDSNLILLHSHPDNLPPSRSDVEQLLRIGVSSIIVVGKNNLVFKVNNMSYRPSTDDWDYYYKYMVRNVNEELAFNEILGELSYSERNFIAQHETIFRIVRQFGWKIEGGYLNV